MTDKVMGFYKSVLSFSGMKINVDGSIYGQLGNSESAKTIPKINNEPLVFPQESQFKDQNQNKVYFHPLSESFIRGESEVIQVLRNQIAMRFNYTFAIVVEGLLTLLVSPELHKELSQDQSDLLKYVKEADDGANINWSELMVKQIKKDYQGCFIKLYLKTSGVFKGETYPRLGVIQFPFYKDLIDGKFDKQLRVKDVIAFRKVIEFIFPEINIPEAYNYGARVRTAPFLNALLNTSGIIAERFNEIIKLYGKYIQASESLKFNMDWVNDIEDIDRIISESKKLPDLKGNTGSITVKERLHPPQELVREELNPPPATVNNSSYAPVAAPKTLAPQQQYIQQQQPTIKPAPANSSGEINFADVLRCNPAMMYNNNVLANNGNPNFYNAPPPVRVPGWAGGNNFNQQSYLNNNTAPPQGQQWVMGPNNTPMLVPVQTFPQQYGQQQIPAGYQMVMGQNGVPMLVPTQQVQNNLGPTPPSGWSYR